MDAAEARLRRAVGLGLMLLCLVLVTSAQAQPAAAPAAPPVPARSESFLAWMVRASGLIGLVILLMSFYLVAVVAWMFLNFRRNVALPPALLDELAGLLGRKQYEPAYHRLINDGSFLARTLAPAVRRLSSGLPAAQRALELANEEVTMEMEHRTTYLATVGTLGPMIGLVGTVYGMIRSFQVIATMGASPQASQLAAGISTALFATLEGIAISVPAIAFYALFRNRIARLSLDVQVAAEGFLEQFAAGVRPLHPLVPTGRAALPPKD
jgi:biopolymer transport protein ExbB